MKRTKIAAIDAGTTKVCTIMADTNGTGDVRILGVGMATSEGLEKGVVINTEKATASISKSLRKAQKMAGYSLRSAYVGVSGTDMSSLNNKGVVSIPHNNEVVHRSDQKRALEIGRSVEIPKEQKLLHVIPRSYKLDGKGNIKDPVGMYGFRLDVETHIVTTPATLVQNLAKCIISLGISIDGMVLTSLASAEAVLTEDERQNGVMLVDIGGATTDVAIFKEGNIHNTFNLPIGGHHITNDIAIGLQIPFEIAEKMKQEYGDVNPFEEKDSSNITTTEDGHSVSQYDLYEIIEARIEELFRLIIFNMQEANYAKVIPSGLVLTGGSSNLQGIAELGGKVTKLPVRVGIPLNLDASNVDLCDPACATSIGLLYWKIRQTGSQGWDIRKKGLEILLPKWLGYFNSKKLAYVK